MTAHLDVRDRHKGQATVEFALILPLVVACMAVVLVAGVLVHDQLALSETARLAVRSAIVSDDPSDSAQQVIETIDSNIDVHTVVDEATGLVTVSLEKSRKIPLWLFQSVLPTINLRARAVMALEPPVVIGS